MSLSKTVDVETFLVGTAVQAGLHPKREYLLSRAVALAADNQDPLRKLRNEFFYPKKGTLPDVDPKLIDPDEDSIYLCGNSLGLMPKATKEITREQFEKWAHMGVFGHTNKPVPWAVGDEECVNGIAEIVGAHPSEVALANGLTVNIHVLLTAFYKPTEKRHKILLESKAFPSDHYAIESQIRLHGRKVEDSMLCLEPREGEDTLRMEDIEAYIEKHGDEIAVIFFSGIQYYTGQLFDMSRITAIGHKKGCLVGWDLAHAFANVPLALTAWDVDFACWCTYKYGSSGAGGLAGLYVNKRFANDKRERLLGWWSHKLDTRFAMTNELDLDTGANGYRISNPPAFLVTGILGFLKVYKKTSMSELRNKSLCLTGYLEFLIEHYFSDDKTSDSAVRVQIMTPKDPAQRGCQLSLKFNIDIGKVYQKLVARGCAVDKRYPHVIRVAPVHFYNSFLDVWRFVNVLRECVKEL